MPTTEELLNAYMVQDIDIPDEGYYPRHLPMNEGRVTPLVDGSTYFTQLQAAIESVGRDSFADNGRQGIYIAGWTLESAVRLNGPGSEQLWELLAAKRQAGVDVRVMVWVNDFVMAAPFPIESGHEKVQKSNLQAVETLRSVIMGPTYVLADRVLVNTLDNPLGACHLKFALVFTHTWAKGFTGGVDLQSARWSDDHHAINFVDDVTSAPVYNGWHDCEAMVEGAGTEQMFFHFRNMWNECIRRRDALDYNPRFRFRLTDGSMSDPLDATPASATAIPDDKVIGVTSGLTAHRVQILRTIPKVNFLLWSDPEISFAPEGMYEIELALRKAIGAAKKYVYIEDQAMLSREIFGMLRGALTRAPTDGSTNELKVILVTGVSDPADPPKNSRAILQFALLDGLTDEQKGRVVYYNHNQATIHSKVFIVDDVVAIIGSAGMFNRGLFTEWEHAVSFVDTGGANDVAAFRQRLWGEIFSLPDSARNVGSLDAALALWKPGWGTGTPAHRLPRDADRTSDLWSGTWTFDGPVLTNPVGPAIANGAAGAFPSLTGEFLIPEHDPNTNRQRVATVNVGGVDELPVFRDHRGNRGSANLDVAGLTVVPIPGLASAGPEVVDHQSISADWIPPPDAPVLGGVPRLIGAFVLCTGGANNRYLRRITAQVPGLLTFDPFPNPIDGAFTYAIVLPRVERTDLPEGLSIFETWAEFLWEFLIYDIGDKQWFAGLSRWDQVEIEAAVGEGPAPVNNRMDVMRVQARLAQLGFDWIRIDGDAGPMTRDAIRLFQAITRGDGVVGPGHQDGRVDPNGETLKWLNAENAPRWGLMPTGAPGLGFTNVEVTLQPHDRGDWGSSWAAETLEKAAARFRRRWLSNHPNASLIAVNDVSRYQGGTFQPDHVGHQAGMQIDIRLPRLDADTTQGTAVGAATYDRDTMRAILGALREEGDIAHIFLNDATLIAEGLCTSLADHDDHAHVAIAPPNRK